MHKLTKALIVAATASVLTVTTATAANAAENDYLHLDTDSKVSVTGTGDRIKVTFTSDHEYTGGEGVVECRAMVGAEHVIRGIETQIADASTAEDQKRVYDEINADWRDNTFLDSRRTYKHIGYFAEGDTTTDSVPLGSNAIVPAAAVFCEQPRANQTPYLEAVYTTPRSGDTSTPGKTSSLRTLMSS